MAKERYNNELEKEKHNTELEKHKYELELSNSKLKDKDIEILQYKIKLLELNIKD